MKILSARVLLISTCVCSSIFVIYYSRELAYSGNIKWFRGPNTIENSKNEDSSWSIDNVLDIPSIQLTDPTRDDIKDRCQTILQGDVTRIKTFRRDKSFPWRDRTTDDQVLQIAQNCTYLRMRYRFPPFFDLNVTEEELNFPIAYTILAHKRVNQIMLLLSAIYREHNIHCVHLDKKSPPVTFAALKQAIKCFPNIALSSRRKKVYYAHVSRLEADIVCMKDMLKLRKQDVDWKYLINLCSQDFPIKTNLETVKLLKNLQGRNSIQGQLVIDNRTKMRTRFVYELVHVRENGYQRVVFRKTQRKHSSPPYNMTVVKNSAYNLYTREFLQWALLDSEVGRALLKWSKDTYSPDEHYWFMMNRHPDAPGGSQSPATPLAKRVRWLTARQNQCHGQWIHGICVFGAEDIGLEVKKNRLFLNKFDISNDSSGPICIRRLLDERSTTLYCPRINSNLTESGQCPNRHN